MAPVLINLLILLHAVDHVHAGTCTYQSMPVKPIPAGCTAVEITITNHEVTDVPQGVFDDAANLEEFMLRYSLIEEIPDLRAVSGTLRKLNLSQSPKLAVLHEHIMGELLALKTLVFQQCPLLVSIPDMPGMSLKFLDITDSGFLHVPNLPHSGQSIETLSLYGPKPQLCDETGKVMEPDRTTLLGMASLRHLYIGSKHAACDVGFLPKLFTLYYYNSAFAFLSAELFVNFNHLNMLGVSGNNLEVLDNPCLDYVAIYPDNQGFVCDCRMRYLTYVASAGLFPDDEPCKAPPHMVGVRWGDMWPENFTCSTEDINSNYEVKATTLIPHRHGYCAWPFAASSHQVSSLIECATLCLHQEACQYFNIRPEVGGVWTCHVTSYADDTGATFDVGDRWAWKSYLID